MLAGKSDFGANIGGRAGKIESGFGANCSFQDAAFRADEIDLVSRRPFGHLLAAQDA